MASDAPNTGAATRAPRNDPAPVSALHSMAQFQRASADAQTDAEMIDGIAIAVEHMHQSLKTMIDQSGAGTHATDNEIWRSIAILMTAIRTCGCRLNDFAQAVDLVAGRATLAAAA